jgi:hypothetical protein
LYFHVNEDERGDAWNSRAALALDGAVQGQLVHLHAPRARAHWIKGQRRASGLRLAVGDDHGRAHTVTWTVQDTFMMKGIGYGHPEWAHGGYKGELLIAREDFKPADLDPLAPPHLHVQAIATARHEGEGLSSDGIGIVEQLVIGPHAPSGFAAILDGAP